MRCVDAGRMLMSSRHVFCEVALIYCLNVGTDGARKVGKGSEKLTRPTYEPPTTTTFLKAEAILIYKNRAEVTISANSMRRLRKKMI